MSQNLNEAVGLLKDVLELGRTTTSVVDQVRLDALVAELGPTALDDVERFTVQLAADAQTVADAVVEAEAAAARHVIEEEERAEKEAGQADADAAEREERNRLGVS